MIACPISAVLQYSPFTTGTSTSSVPLTPSPIMIWHPVVIVLNPFKFAKKIFKVGMFAAATQSSAATLPLNRKTCMEELGCSKEISSFVLPMGMTINMNGTTAMHMVAITFIATAAGINITPTQLITAAFLSICVAMGTPAIPVAGTTLIVSYKENELDKDVYNS